MTKKGPARSRANVLDIKPIGDATRQLHTRKINVFDEVSEIFRAMQEPTDPRGFIMDGDEYVMVSLPRPWPREAGYFLQFPGVPPAGGFSQADIDEENKEGAHWEELGHTRLAQDCYDSALRMELDRLGIVRRRGPTASVFGNIETAGGDPRILTDTSHLNRKFAKLEAPGLASAYVSQIDQMPITDVDLKRRLSDHVVMVKDAKGNYASTPAYNAFVKSSRKKVFRKIVFTGKPAEPHCLNLYRGLGVAPKPGKCDLILAHIKEVLCYGADDRYEAMLSLMAWQIQNIGKPSRVIVLLHNPNEQAGKGIILEHVLLHIYGPSGTAPSDTSQITGRFNDILRGMSYIFCDEILFSGDRKTADAFKRLATTSHMPVEGKGLPILQYPIGVNLWLASNHQNAVHVEEGDARYWILRVSEQRIGDNAYFAKLVKEIENGGIEAFAHFLQTRDVSNFVPKRDVPRDNAERREMIQLALNPVCLRIWLEACCHADLVLGMKVDGIPVSWTEGAKHDHGDLWLAYVEWQKTIHPPMARKPTTSNRFGTELGKAGLEEYRTNRSRQRILPSIEKCLERLGDPIIWRE